MRFKKIIAVLVVVALAFASLGAVRDLRDSSLSAASREEVLFVSVPSNVDAADECLVWDSGASPGTISCTNSKTPLPFFEDVMITKTSVFIKAIGTAGYICTLRLMQSDGTTTLVGQTDLVTPVSAAINTFHEQIQTNVQVSAGSFIRVKSVGAGCDTGTNPNLMFAIHGRKL